MTTTSYDDVLQTLPKPQAIEELDATALLERMKARFLAKGQELGYDFSEELLAGTPTMMQLETIVYEHTLIRQRINSAYRSRMVYFAAGTDLDHVLDEFHGLERLDLEPDEDARQRARIRARGRSAAGPDDWWRDHALAADETVEDVGVKRRASYPVPADPKDRGVIEIYILAQTDTGVPDQALLDKVSEALNQSDVRGTVVSVEVLPATSIVVDVTAEIYMTAGAPAGTFERLEAGLRAYHAAERRLGWEPTPSWISARLHQPGVYEVKLIEPSAPQGVGANETVALGAITLIDKGVVAS